MTERKRASKSAKSGKRPAGKRPAGDAKRRRKPSGPTAGPSVGPPGGSPTDADIRPLVVGIGASAGGLEAFKNFFANMPADSGMAFVLVQHLSPTHKSMLTDLLAKGTSMAVTEAADGMAVEPNRVFVIPPNATLTIEGGKLRVAKPAPPREHRRPIDTFFSSLADDQGENAVCIVLSGTGSDGALGVSAIKENGGMTMAQAEFDHSAMDGMPHSAVATGLVDEVLKVEDMPARLLSYQHHLRNVASRKEADGTRVDAGEHLTTIARLLRTRLGHDFSEYKEKTVTRRIQRRMQVLQIDTVPAYIVRLREEPHQLDLLFRELLIGVTQFFRDPLAFEALQAAVIPKLLHHKGAADTIRVWVPGCATGEEVYSIAILLKEAMEQRGVRPRLQIFGTDIDEKAITVARAGRYAKTEGATPERLKRWFAEEGGEFCPVKEIREMCVFSVQSVVKDPPFSRLDLISCRNLLIYMDAPLQDRVLRTFHYALKPDGFLFLGPSEGVTRQSKYFTGLDKKHHIFQRRDADAVLPDIHPAPASERRPLPEAAPAAAGEDRIARKARHAMEKHSPAWLIIDGACDILRFSGGGAGRYLEPSSGAASLNLFAILRKALRPVARAAVRTALATKEAVVNDNVAIRIDGVSRAVSVIVEPLLGEAEAGYCVVAFREAGTRDPGTEEAGAPGADEVQAVEHELRTVKTQLQSTIDELETANEEMKSAAEEYQSVNEELQSSNEELETSKEEMQSINEELQTVNAEMAAKNETLTRLNSDIKNLLDSTQLATLFLDEKLRIKSFTPPMTEIFHLRDADRGRPITDIVSLLDYPGIKRDVEKVMRKLSVVEREVRIRDEGAAFILRIRPYRTVDNVIDGVVMTFMDITGRKADEARAQRLAAIVEASADAIISKDLNGVIATWNQGAERLFGYTAEEAVGKPVTILIPPERRNEEPEILNRIRSGERIDQFESVRRRKDGSPVEVSLSVSPIRDGEGRVIGASKIARDMTEQRRAEAALRESETRYRELFEAIDEGFCIIEKVDTGPGQPIDFRYTDVNPAFAVQSGLSDVVGKTIREVVPGEPQEWFDIYDAVLRTGESIRFERGLVTQGRVLELFAFRVEDETRRRVAVIFSNITERKAAEDHTSLLLGELDHRVKNILAIISSVIKQTLKSSETPAAFTASMEGRIAAIAGAHSLLTRDGGRGEASLRDLIQRELAPYERRGGNLKIGGPDVMLTPKAGLSLAMAIHELASNASKYGALSAPGGRLTVTWSSDAASPALKLVWAETDGPPVKPPTRSGFGSTLLDRTLSHDLDGEVSREFLPSGLRCTIRLPLTGDVGHLSRPDGSSEGMTS